MKTFNKMLKIEMKLSIRDMNMVIFAIIMPVIILIVLGMIYGTKPAFLGADYSFIEQSFGALVSIAICASGLMGIPLVVSEYRERKILKRFQVTPVSPLMIILVQLVIYTIYSLSSLIILWLLASIFYDFQMKGSILLFIVGYLLVLVSILSIGILVGGIAKNSKQASVAASILYFPMLVFSGATLPYEIMPAFFQKIVDLMPLTQGIKILKAATLNIAIENIFMSAIIIAMIALLCIILAIKYFKWE